MEKEILDKLNYLFFRPVKLDDKHSAVFLYRFIEKKDSSYNFIVLFPNYKEKEIVYKMTFKKLNSAELNLLIPVNNMFPRLIVTPSKVMVDPETKIGFTTIQNKVYAFFNKEVIDKNIMANNTYATFHIKKFDNEQEVKDNLFKNFLETSNFINDDYILDECTKKYNTIMEDINKCKDRAKRKDKYQYILNKLEHMTPENDYYSYVEKYYDDLINNQDYVNEVIKANNLRKFSESELNNLKNISYDDKRTLLVEYFQSIVDFDIEGAKDYYFEQLGIVYPYILRLLKNKGIIEEQTDSIGKKYNKLTEEKDVDFSKLN